METLLLGGCDEEGQAVQVVGRSLQGLTRHDVHILGEEHAAAAALAHRLDKGVLDLGEVPGVDERILVLDDLRSLDEEEGIVSGEHHFVDEDRAVLLVGFLRGLEPGALLHGVADSVHIVAEVPVHILPLLAGDTELPEEVFAEIVGADEHTHGANIERRAEAVKDRRHDHVGDVHARVVITTESVNRVRDLVRHGQVALLAVEAGRHGRSGSVDPVGLTVRDEHERRNLNVVRADPILKNLRGEDQRLHGGRVGEAHHPMTLLRHIGFVQVGEKPLALGCGVCGRGQVEQLGIPELNRVRVIRGVLGVLGEAERLVGLAVVGSLLPLLALLVELLLAIHPCTVREAEHLKRNLRLLAEPNQLQDLKEAVVEVLRHRPGQVDEEHDAVVLAVLLDDLRQEDIVVGAELVQAVKVEHPRLLGTLTPNLVRCLLALKLRDQLAHERIRLAHELPVLVKVDGRMGGIGVALLLVVAGDERIGRDDLIHVVRQGKQRDRTRLVVRSGLADERPADVHDVLAVLTARDDGFPLIVTLTIGNLTLPGTFSLVALNEVLLLLLHLRAIVEALGKVEHLRESFDLFDLVRDGLL